MKVGIVVYSQTGNTLSVAEKLRDKLAARGHGVSLERLSPTLADPKDLKSFRFDSLPDLSGYEAVVLAAPVQGFSLCRAMAAYLRELPDLSGRLVACFATKQLNSAWTGGSKALASMSEAAEAKGGRVCAAGFVCWKSRQREKDIEDLTEKLAKALEFGPNP